MARQVAKRSLIHSQQLEKLIFVIRGQKVMLDADLAKVYGVSTKVLNQAVKRNTHRFPKDFVFKLAPEEGGDIRSQIVTGSSMRLTAQSEFAIASKRSIRYLPYVFTEHGALMAANVLLR